jgi:Rieske Fe-S protein
VVTVAGGVAGYLVATNSSAAKGKRTTYGGGSSGGPASGHLLAQVSAIPLGGGIVLGGPKVVLSRAASGAVHGFSAVCTHQGCTVGQVQNGLIICPCHGSRFNAFTGAVVEGPANTPLPSVSISIQNGGVYSA